MASAQGSAFVAGQPLQALPSSYYLGLLTSEYRSSPKFMAMTAALLQPLFDLITCLLSFQGAFDLDTAEGVQLDLLGQIIGVARTVTFIPSDDVSPVLDDPTYRLLLRARLGWNLFSGNLGALQSLWLRQFPSGEIVVSDQQNMSATVFVTGAFSSSILVDLVENGYLVPRPQGVQFTYIMPVLPILGCDQNTAFLAGVDLGHAT